jgi:hypothetical protein
MHRVMRCFALLFCATTTVACASPQLGSQSAPAAAKPIQVQRVTHFAWQERFSDPLDWIAPAGPDPSVLASVFHGDHEGPLSFLHAAHDARPGAAAPAPAIHFGKDFRDAPIPLDRVIELQWKWRVLHHPDVTDDPWRDVAASVYMITKAPGVFAGRGFKFGWLAKPGPQGTKQRGLLQIALRTDAASNVWREESTDLCALHRRAFGPCEGEHVLYVGVMTDADNTASLSIAEYADFALRVAD